MFEYKGELVSTSSTDTVIIGLNERVDELEAERRYLLDAIQHWYMYGFDRGRALEILDKSSTISST